MSFLYLHSSLCIVSCILLLINSGKKTQELLCLFCCWTTVQYTDAVVSRRLTFKSVNFTENNVEESTRIL